ncbi:MAG: hypothetical protein ABIA59_02675 [Candidatus Latescibacterota bacterium]
MKLVFTRIALLSVICALVLSSGCVYDPSTGQAVITEQICVNLDEYREGPELGSAVVCEKFKERLLARIAAYGATLADVESITMTSGTYKVTKPASKNYDHDWVITAAVDISRQDDPYGPVTAGPERFINMTSQSLRDAKAAKTIADLNSAGVDLVNDALQALLDGEDPRLVLTLIGGGIDPAPSPLDPLSFKWLACVEFQAVVNVGTGK